MHRWRTIAGLVAVLLCVLLAGHITQAQQTEPSGEGVEDQKVRPPDDDEVIVKPKGQGVGVGEMGFEWQQCKRSLVKGEEKKFRLDLHMNLTKLQARKQGGVFLDADVVEFKIDKFKFTVRKEKGKYIWEFPSSHKQTSCKGNGCKNDGIPPEAMAGNKRGTIRAKFPVSGWVESLDEVLMRGASCQALEDERHQ